MRAHDATRRNVRPRRAARPVPGRMPLAPRRGVTALIAMLYLVLISSLAVGFYASMSTSSQLAHNDEDTARAYLSAESGMDFMRRQLANVSIPPSTEPDDAIDHYYSDLQSILNGSGNLGSLTIGRSGNTINIPSSGFVKLDSAGNAKFRSTITDWAGEIVVKVEGFYGGSGVQRTITMDYSRQQKTTTIFDYAVASKGQIVMSKGAVTSVTGVDPMIATMLSAKPSGNTIVVGGGTIGGDVTIMDGALAAVTGGSVGGSSVVSDILANHVHSTDKEPEFPTFDTSVFLQYATNAWSSGKKTQKNIRIPANTNPKFNGNDVVQGIMYVESPNQVTFNGNFKLQGFIVMAPGASSSDLLDFKGNLTQSPVPNGSEFDSVRSTSGVAILAPNAKVTMSGSTDSYLKGSVVSNRFEFKGSADIQIDLGTLMTLDEGDNSCVFNGKTVKFTGTGATNQPSQGVTYSTYYAPKPATYQEPMP